MVFWGRVTSGEAQDSEHYHDNPCPWVVVSSAKMHGRLPIVQASPLTSKLDKKGPPFRIYVPADSRIDYAILGDEVPLTKASIVLVEQTRVFAHARLIGNPVAKLAPQTLSDIEVALKYVLDLA
jgi:mRNA-degrading endonuclease toxin of MazEF toxin-antitoxin module